MRMKKKVKTNYVNNENLLQEIALSKAKQEQHPDWTPAQCFTPKLTNMLMEMVYRYAGKYNWRGYSYNDEMRSEALVSLCQSALKFDASRSQNPFGYYTMIITRCFITYLEKEKQLRSIRDDLIEMSDTDLKPSMGRQIEDEMKKFNSEASDTNFQAHLNGQGGVTRGPRPGRTKKSPDA